MRCQRGSLLIAVASNERQPTPSPRSKAETPRATEAEPFHSCVGLVRHVTNNLLQVLRRTAHGFTNYADFEARGILLP